MKPVEMFFCDYENDEACYLIQDTNIDTVIKILESFFEKDNVIYEKEDLRHYAVFNPDGTYEDALMMDKDI